MNKEIQKHLKAKNPNYFAGVALYEKYDLKASLKNNFITKGATDFNKRTLKNELERLEKIDPKIIEDKRQQIADDLKAKKELADKLAEETAEREAQEEADRLEQEQANNQTSELEKEELEKLKELPKVVVTLQEELNTLKEQFGTLSEAFAEINVAEGDKSKTDKTKK